MNSCAPFLAWIERLQATRKWANRSGSAIKRNRTNGPQSMDLIRFGLIELD